MTFFSAFALEFGGLLALMALIAAWLFRQSAAPLWLRLVVPAIMVALACYAPWRISALLGYPAAASLADLPQKAQLVGFVPHDDTGLVDLWLRSGDVPRAYEVKLDDQLKKTLRAAAERMARGGQVFLKMTPSAKTGRKTAHDPNGLGDDSHYVLEEVQQLPPKE